MTLKESLEEVRKTYAEQLKLEPHERLIDANQIAVDYDQFMRVLEVSTQVKLECNEWKQLANAAKPYVLESKLQAVEDGHNYTVNACSNWLSSFNVLRKDGLTKCDNEVHVFVGASKTCQCKETTA